MAHEKSNIMNLIDTTMGQTRKLSEKIKGLPTVNDMTDRTIITNGSDGSLGKMSAELMLDGVFIMYHRNNDNSALLAKPYKWAELQSKGEVADGVAIVEGGRVVLVVAPTEAGGDGLTWSGTEGEGGGVTAADRIAAMADFEGQSNTEAIVSKSTSVVASYAPGFCRLYSRVNTKGAGITAGKWWLPSAGELIVIYSNLAKINYCLNIISDGMPLTENWYWSSTDRNARTAWGLRFEDGLIADWNIKVSSKCRVRPVSTFIQ